MLRPGLRYNRESGTTESIETERRAETNHAGLPIAKYEHGYRVPGRRENDFNLPIAREHLVSSVSYQLQFKLNLGV